jgi:predicted ATPase/class 3 adenylate cyclase
MNSGEAAQQIKTYVFTDLVGSTRLTRTLPTPVWRRLKDRHDNLVREHAAAAGGQFVKGLGDGFLVVFPSEEGAVGFAIALQRAVGSEPWRDGTAPEVRVGMDTGPALYRSDPPDYEGDAINVASHICARARAGEVLLSARCYFGIRPELERSGGEVRLEPVGEVRLKGLPTAEPLYRAWASGLREGYPPLTRTGNLTAFTAPPPFVGREELLAEVIDELARRPVVTLVGPGGIGKTRLATEVGLRVEPRFPAGTWMAPLENVHRSDAVAAEVLAILGSSAEGMEPEEALLGRLTDWHGLLILDNVEQLVETADGAFSQLVAAIARRCSQARVLCTSRIDLRLGDALEARFELPPLPPPPGARESAAELSRYPSVQLCAERLRQRVRQFVVDDRSAPHVAAICRATDGVPLLIELAAGQLGRQTLPAIARDVARALAAPSRDVARPDRHRDLARLLDWSVALLGEERDFFLQLGVFPGSFDVEAAATVTEETRTEEFLQRLVDAHLVCGPATEDYLAEEPRYRLLNATASYCRTRLGEALPAARRRHAEHLGGVARALSRELLGTAPSAALERLGRERENVAAALESALEIGNLELAADLGGPLWELLHRLGVWPLIRDGASRLLAASGGTGRPAAAAWMALAQAAHDEGQVAAARDGFQAAADLWRATGDEVQAARALHGLGNALRRQNPAAAEQAYLQSLEVAIRQGEEPLRALNLTALGLVASGQGRLDEAEERHAEALALLRRWEDPWGLSIALNSRAQNLERQGQHPRARDLYAEALALKQRLGDRRGTAITLAALARLAPAAGTPEGAEALLRESLSVNRELGDAWGCAVTLGALAERRLVEGAAGPALEAAAAARQCLDFLGGSGSPEAARLDTLIQTARARLISDQADVHERRGRETPILRAADDALRRGEPAGE